MTDNKKVIKIPGQDGVEVKHTLCDICAPAFHCGVDCYVKDGKVLKVEGWKDHPASMGGLCTKGLGNREYVYREDRIMTPLKRVGERGEGKFEPISWDEAYKIIAENLNGIKKQYGADKVAVYSGYNKWYRSMLGRFAHSFGTQSYGNEGSSCYTSGAMAWQCISGMGMGMNFPQTDLFIGWGTNGYYSRWKMSKGIENFHKRGMKYIIVDPRITPATERVADLHLRPHLGTDGALALTMANALIAKGYINTEYIEKYVHGFDAYKEYVSQFTLEKGEELTGVPAAEIMKAVEMIGASSSMSICESAAPLAHHYNGMQNYRAIMSLLLITGNVDVPGGQMPSFFTFAELGAGFRTHEEEYLHKETYPKDAAKAVGHETHPLWYELRGDMQANDLPANILRQDENSIRALYAHGMNYRMFTDDNKYVEAFKKLDFYVDVDLFLTDSAKWADIVLPCCSSLERSEFKAYAGCNLWYTKPVIQPLGESKRDVDIITELAGVMGIEDEHLICGYEEAVRYMFRDVPVDLDEVMASEVPVKVEGIAPYKVGTMLEQGWPTPSGKLELYCEVIARHPEWGLEPLPVYAAPPCPDKEKYPFVLCSGVRLPNMLHSRLHNSRWERSLCPEPIIEISMEDAETYGIEMDDVVEVSTPLGAFTYKAVPTKTVMSGEVYVYHGYSDRDINAIIPYEEIADPYSGFPAYRSAYCNIRRV